MAIWDDILTPRDHEVFALSGYGKRAGFGQRPAILVIDVNYNFVGDKSEPILESVKRFRNSRSRFSNRSNAFATAAGPKDGKAYITLANCSPKRGKNICRHFTPPATTTAPTASPSAAGKQKIAGPLKI